MRGRMSTRVGGKTKTRGSWGGQLRTVCKIRHRVDELSQVEGDSIVFFAKAAMGMRSDAV